MLTVRFMWGEFFYSGEMIGGGRCAALFLCLKNLKKNQKKFKKSIDKHTEIVYNIDIR